MKNKFLFFKDYTEIVIISKKYGEQKAIIDNESIYKIYKYKWGLLFDNKMNGFYIISRNKNKNIFLHRLVTNCPKGLEVDHVNHNTLDNRLENLKVCTHKENMQNRNIQKNNKTGYSGIDFKNNKYRVQIGKNRKHIGLFKTLEEAKIALLEANKNKEEN